MFTYRDLAVPTKTDRATEVERSARRARGGVFCEAIPEPPAAQRADPDIIHPENGYGGAGHLSTGVGPRRQAQVLTDGLPEPAVYRPAPTTSLARRSAPGAPEVFATDALPDGRVRTYGSVQAGGSGVGNTLAELRARDIQKDRVIAGLQQQVAEMAARAGKARGPPCSAAEGDAL